ncbi:zinc finger protein 626-like [Anopheles moucheti]|uniref:zinc finger protein 626-like n=1 Tax=Anopheles moucheti TaxID=186751 RepID=UPI0022F05656|nr:zinc finger protein 626-like [Anopheles moucheti]
MDETVRKSDNVCRLCLSQDKKHLIPASVLINASFSIQDVERFTGIQIQQDESVPIAICTDCGEKIENSVAFRKLCAHNDALFRQLFGLMVEITPQDDRCSVTLSMQAVIDHVEELSMESNCTEILHNTDTEENGDETEEAFNQTLNYSSLELNPDRMVVELDGQVDCAEDSEKQSNGPETSNPVNPLSCPPDGRRSSSQHHIRNVHLKNTSKTCSMCGETFSSYYAYKYHKASQYGNREYAAECGICSKKFCNVTTYNAHYGRYHATADEKNHPKMRKKQLCGICGMMVTQLSTHSLTHSQERHLACPHCPIKMADKGNLSRHIQAVHLKKVVRTCEMCGKEFLHVNLYKYHMLSVHGVGKTFDCDICLKKFKTLAVLKFHKVSLHSNEKRFECGICGMMFKVKHTLRTHEKRVHSVEKPFVCSQCPKRFKSPYGKKSHELTHSGIVFSCTFCEKAYRYKSLLQAHTRKQHSKMVEINRKS